MDTDLLRERLVLESLASLWEMMIPIRVGLTGGHYSEGREDALCGVANLARQVPTLDDLRRSLVNMKIAAMRRKRDGATLGDHSIIDNAQGAISAYDDIMEITQTVFRRL